MQGKQEQQISTGKLAAIRALPIWTGDLSIAPLKGGISNESWIVTDGNGPRVVRFGEDYPFHHVDRAHEAMVARAAHVAGLAPQVFASSPGLMVSEFLAAETGSPDSVRNNIASHAAVLKSFHETMPLKVSGYARLFWVFHVLRDYARTISSNASRHTTEIPAWMDVAVALEAAQVPLPLVFGHNDLLPANFLYSKGRIWLIDFEYSAYSTAMFDLAGMSSNSGFDREQSLELLTVYFGHEPEAGLIRALEAMQCASLLREAMWSMVSEIFLNAPGVDYVAYTASQLSACHTRLDDYQSRYGKIVKS
jgi:thiamine kinase-like enzyme